MDELTVKITEDIVGTFYQNNFYIDPHAYKICIQKK